MSGLVCPDHKTLERFMFGILPDTEADLVEQHVENCDPCFQTLQACTDQDTLHKTLQNPPAGTAPLPAPEALQPLMKQLNALQPEAEADSLATLKPPQTESNAGSPALLAQVRDAAVLRKTDALPGSASAPQTVDM